MHHVHFHDGVGVADATRHGAHMLAINQDAHAQRFDDLLDENGNQMGGPLLILQSPGKISRDTRQPVSYTHLDVYKRQYQDFGGFILPEGQCRRAAFAHLQ